MSRENKKVSIKVNGSFYVGDICYCLKDDVYDNVWGGAGYADGAYTDPETGLQFAMVSTAYGDGCYSGDDGYDYGVDAGVIGIVDMGLSKETEEELDDYGTVHHYTGEVSIEYENGTITVEFGNESIVIETEEDDYWDIDDDDEDEEYHDRDNPDYEVLL